MLKVCSRKKKSVSWIVRPEAVFSLFCFLFPVIALLPSHVSLFSPFLTTFPTIFHFLSVLSCCFFLLWNTLFPTLVGCHWNSQSLRFRSNTVRPRSYRKFILQITQPFQYGYANFQYRCAVTSGSPSTAREKRVNGGESVLSRGLRACAKMKAYCHCSCSGGSHDHKWCLIEIVFLTSYL